MTDESGRLFVAAIPPADVRDALAAIPRPDVEGVRWTRPEQWHVTLLFLGTTSVQEAADALSRLTAPKVAAVVLGPSVRRLGQRVAMVPVEGLDDLATAVVAATVDIGEPPDRRGFVGHITLARSRTRMPAEVLGSAVSAEFCVEDVVLVRSHLDQVGPRYEVVSARHLGEELQ